MRADIVRHHRMGDMRRIHFVGVGGVGMSGIAMVLANQGFHVSGSDCGASSPVIERLRASGVEVYSDHDAAYVNQADVLVVSSAISEDNVECQAAISAGIPRLKRAEMLSELMRFHRGIAISGTHGKTTTTSLVASIFDHAGEDPTYVIGGHIKCAAGQMRVGQQDYFIAEADESDASFLYLRPVLAVITSIDFDHLDTYQGSIEILQQAFVQFAHQLPFYGSMILCLDDAYVAALKPDIQRPCVTYGWHAEADYRLISVDQKNMLSTFVLQCPKGQQHTFQLNFPGAHQVNNAVAAIVVARCCQIDWPVIAQALCAFPGVKRRFDVLGCYTMTASQTGIRVIDDYGHHPKAIAVTLTAARDAWPDRRIVLCFEPHRYTRLQALFDDFVQALAVADVLLLMPVYACSESNIPGFDTRALLDALKAVGHASVHEIEHTEQLEPMLQQVMQSEDVLICQGAGVLSQQIQALVGSWQAETVMAEATE